MTGAVVVWFMDRHSFELVESGWYLSKYRQSMSINRLLDFFLLFLNNTNFTIHYCIGDIYILLYSFSYKQMCSTAVFACNVTYIYTAWVSMFVCYLHCKKKQGHDGEKLYVRGIWWWYTNSKWMITLIVCYGFFKLNQPVCVTLFLHCIIESDQ